MLFAHFGPSYVSEETEGLFLSVSPSTVLHNGNVQQTARPIRLNEPDRSVISGVSLVKHNVSS